MTRTTRTELDALAGIISREAGEEYFIQHAYGQPRLFRAGGSVEVSPRLPSGEMARWMRAFIQGMGAADRAAREARS